MEKAVKAWLAPGIIISLLMLAISFVSGYAGSKYRAGEDAAHKREVDRRLAMHEEELKDRVRKELYLEFLERYRGDQANLEREISEARRVSQK